MAHAIEVEALGKRYPIGSRGPGYVTLRESLSSIRGRQSRGTGDDGIWALRDVSLTVDEGEVVGVVGQNGAGKTTLLKVLTRITEPTTGATRTRGRVGALLEVGTGFHPELTGRENVYLNGAILGMRRREIKRKFDEIVDFAELNRFIDTPVKRYSSGMQMRLAFAVAAHLEPEVLIVDEVLAVGDAVFQRKSLGRMDEVAHEGRTVLFVSHNLSAITQLCHRTIWLDRGRVRLDGESVHVVESYLESIDERALASASGSDDHSGVVELRSAEIRDRRGRIVRSARRGETFEVVFRFWLRERVPGLDVALYILSSRGTCVIDEAWSDDPERLAVAVDPGEYEATMTLPPLLAAGTYSLGVWIGTTAGSGDETFVHREVMSFRILPRPGDHAAWAERDRVLTSSSGLQIHPHSEAED